MPAPQAGDAIRVALPCLGSIASASAARGAATTRPDRPDAYRGPVRRAPRRGGAGSGRGEQRLRHPETIRVEVPPGRSPAGSACRAGYRRPSGSSRRSISRPLVRRCTVGSHEERGERHEERPRGTRTRSRAHGPRSHASEAAGPASGKRCCRPSRRARHRGHLLDRQQARRPRPDRGPSKGGRDSGRPERNANTYTDHRSGARDEALEGGRQAAEERGHQVRPRAAAAGARSPARDRASQHGEHEQRDELAGASSPTARGPNR